MKNEYGIVGVAHIGLPTNDLKKTIEFYKSLVNVKSSYFFAFAISFFSFFLL